MKTRSLVVAGCLLLLGAVVAFVLTGKGWSSVLLSEQQTPATPAEDTWHLSSGESMMADIEKQVSFGPRHAGERGHEQILKYVESEAERIGLRSVRQSWTHENADGSTTTFSNLLVSYTPDNARRVLLGTHFDTKAFAEEDMENKDAPVPGANDGASGVSVLLEIARVLAQRDDKPAVGVDFVFFDGEEGEVGVSTHDSRWVPLGSTYFVEHLEEYYEEGVLPETAIILDMVCDRDLTLPMEGTSALKAPSFVASFYSHARSMHPDVFSGIGMFVRDDHTPFLEKGIDALLLIDTEYPFWHTTEDTPDKCSPESLVVVADTVATFVLDRYAR